MITNVMITNVILSSAFYSHIRVLPSRPSVRPSVRPSAHPSVRPSVRPSAAHPSVRPSAAHPSVRPYPRFTLTQIKDMASEHVLLSLQMDGFNWLIRSQPCYSEFSLVTQLRESGMVRTCLQHA